MNPTSLLHPSVEAWFFRQFRAPTPAQVQAWPAIRAGEHVLLAAPTGSGKTLAAFLAAIDSLVRKGLEGELKDETQIVYVSPLKALSNDIEKNLAAPLKGISEELRRLSLAGPARSPGDRKPPRIMVPRRIQKLPQRKRSFGFSMSQSILKKFGAPGEPGGQRKRPWRASG